MPATNEWGDVAVDEPAVLNEWGDVAADSGAVRRQRIIEQGVADARAARTAAKKPFPFAPYAGGGELADIQSEFQPMQIPRMGFTPKPDDEEPVPGTWPGLGITKGTARKAGAIIVNAAASAAEGMLHPATPAIISAATVAPEVVIPALTAQMAKSGSTNLAEGLVDLQQGRDSEGVKKIGNAVTELFFAAAPAAGAKGLAARERPAASTEAVALAPRTTAAVEHVATEIPKAESAAAEPTPQRPEVPLSSVEVSAPKGTDPEQAAGIRRQATPLVWPVRRFREILEGAPLNDVEIAALKSGKYSVPDELLKGRPDLFGRALTDQPVAQPVEQAGTPETTSEYIEGLPNQPYQKRTATQIEKEETQARRLIEEKYRFSTPEVQRQHGIDPVTGLIPVKPVAKPVPSVRTEVTHRGSSVEFNMPEAEFDRIGLPGVIDAAKSAALKDVPISGASQEMRSKGMVRVRVELMNPEDAALVAKGITGFAKPVETPVAKPSPEPPGAPGVPVSWLATGLEDFVGKLKEFGSADGPPMGQAFKDKWIEAVRTIEEGNLPAAQLTRGINEVLVTTDVPNNIVTFHVEGYDANNQLATESVSIHVTEDGALRMFASSGKVPRLRDFAVEKAIELLRGKVPLEKVSPQLTEPVPSAAPAEAPAPKEPWQLTKAQWRVHEQRATAYDFTDPEVTAARSQENLARKALDNAKTARKALGNTESIRKVMTDRQGALERNQQRRDADKAVEEARKANNRASSRSVALATHEGFIKRALARGESVPPEVLADYPDLAKPKEPTATTTAAAAGAKAQAEGSAAPASPEASTETAIPKPAKTLIGLPEDYFDPANLRKLRKDTLRRLGNSLGVEPTVGAIAKKAAERFSQMPEGGGPVSMGAATPGEFGEASQTAGTPAHQVETAPPQERPLGIVDPSTSTFANLAVEMLTGAPTGGVPSPYSIDTMIKGLAGHSAPKLTTLSRTAGEALVRYAASRIAAPFKAIWFSAKVLQTGIDQRKYGAAIVEDNLRSIEQNFLRRSHEARAAGQDSLADEFAEKAANARSIVGGANSPFQTEAEYIDFLNDPVTQETVRRHAQMWQEDIEPQFKAAQGIDPDVELPTRGQQTGARINLKAIFEGEESGRAVGTIRGGLTASFKRKSPFGIEARGTGDVYEIDFVKLMENTYRRQLEIANQNAMNAMLVDQGLAKIAKPGEHIDINGEPAVPFPLSRRLILTEGKAIPAGQNINVARSFADEYRMALSSDSPQAVPFITPIANALNRAALWGLTDAGIHISNLFTILFTRPNSPLLWDTLAKAADRIDVPITVVRGLLKASMDNREQLARIAEIGALREDFHGMGPLSKAIKWADQTTRLMLHDTYLELKRLGIASPTETAEREFVNQAGQYNKRLQGQWTVWLRDTQIGPFVTAGKTLNVLGVRVATLSAGLEAASPMAAAALRVNQLAGWVGFFSLLGTLNYLITRNKGGYIMGRPGVPIGNLDTGLDNDKGQPLSIPLGAILGYTRSMRVTGLRRVIEGARYGLNTNEALDNAFGDVVNSVIGPAAGPVVRFGSTAIFGSAPALNVGRIAPAAGPQQSQFALNVQTALREANPIVASIMDIREGKPISQAVQRQLPRFTLQSSQPVERAEHLSERVEGARINEYADDLARRARRLPIAERLEFVKTEMNNAKLTPGEQEAVAKKIRPRLKYP